MPACVHLQQPVACVICLYRDLLSMSVSFSECHSGCLLGLYCLYNIIAIGWVQDIVATAVECGAPGLDKGELLARCARV